jgi:hypothetical protein
MKYPMAIGRPINLETSMRVPKKSQLWKKASILRLFLPPKWCGVMDPSVSLVMDRMLGAYQAQVLSWHILFSPVSFRPGQLRYIRIIEMSIARDL